MSPNIRLNDGNEIPTMAFGTGSKWKGLDVSVYVEQAINSGFGFIDTAAFYGNESSVGKAIRETGLSRSELYISTKWGVFPDGGEIQASIRGSLAKLGVASVDLYLVHDPALMYDEEHTWEWYWSEIESVKEQGLTRSIGVSNFSVEDLQRTIKSARIKPAVNQIEIHPYNYAAQRSVIEYARKHGIVTEGYSSLTSITACPGGPVDAVVAKIGERMHATPAQVIMLWVRAKGVVIVTTSSKAARLAEFRDIDTLREFLLGVSAHRRPRC
ncbi:Aldo/keto reductase [Athelia psychrophila]|uniref:Aldo/keto reductase n=1 Tax=Athelia psychrophila TaxID=1759441 RepID=A0A166H7E0_9AGAM|nr:Aldo/keto reductase [Fibularhizoctonia sp. CBS 109695]